MSAPRKIGCAGVLAWALIIIAGLAMLGQMAGGPLE